MTSASLLFVFALAQPATPSPAVTPDLFVKASISTAGPNGELWILHLTPNSDALLRVYYSLTPSGSLMAEFDVGDEHLDRLRTAVKEHHFFDLPAEISPPTSPLHQPDLTLEITLGARKHKVRLYDPDHMKGDGRVKRFLALWAAMYDKLPLKPSW